MLPARSIVIVTALLLLLLVVQLRLPLASASPVEPVSVTKCISLSDVSQFFTNLLSIFDNISKLLGNLSLNNLDIGSIGDSIDKLLGGISIKSILSTVVNDLKNITSALPNVGSLFGDISAKLMNYFDSLINEINITGLVSNFLSNFTGELSSMVSNLGKLGTSTLSQAVQNLVNSIIGKLSGALTSARNAVTGTVSQHLGNVDSLVGAANTISKSSNSLLQALINACDNPKSLLVETTTVCSRVSTLTNDASKVQGDLLSIVPLVSGVESSVSALPQQIDTLSQSLPSITVSLTGGSISSCTLPTPVIDLGSGTNNVGASLSTVTGTLATVSAMVSGYYVSNPSSGTMSAQVSGTFSGTEADGTKVTWTVSGVASSGFLFTGTFIGPVSVTGSQVSGQVIGTLSGTLSGSVSSSNGFKGTLSDDLSGVTVIGTLTGTATTSQGSITITSGRISVSSYAVTIDAAEVQGTSSGTNPQSVSGYLEAGSSMTLTGTVQLQQVGVDVGLMTSLNSVTSDINDISSTISAACTGAGLINVDTDLCTAAASAKQTSGSMLTTALGYENTVTSTISTVVTTVANLQNDINGYFKELVTSIQNTATITIPDSIKVPVSKSLSSLSITANDLSSNLKAPMDDLKSLSNTINRLGTPLDTLTTAVKKVGSLVGTLKNDAKSLQSTLSPICKSNGLGGFIDKGTGTGYAQSACNIITSLYDSADEIQIDVGEIANNIADIRSYITTASVWISKMQTDIGSIDSNVKSISNSLGSMSSIISKGTLNRATCITLNQNIVSVESSVNHISTVATNNLPSDINNFLLNVNNAVSAIPNDIDNIKQAVTDIIQTINDFVNTVKQAADSASGQGSGSPVPTPTVCIGVTYATPVTNYPGAGNGCIVLANKLTFATAKFYATVTLAATATASVSASQSVQGTLTGTFENNPQGIKGGFSTVVPLTVGSNSGLTISPSVSGIISGSISAAYVGTFNGRPTFALIGTLSGTLTSADSLSAAGDIYAGIAGGSGVTLVGQGATGSIAGSAVASFSYSLPYYIVENVRVRINGQVSCGSSTDALGFSCTFSNDGRNAVTVQPYSISVLRSGGSKDFKLSSAVSDGIFTNKIGKVDFSGQLSWDLSSSEIRLSESAISLKAATLKVENVKVSASTVVNVKDALVGNCRLSLILNLQNYFK